MKDGYVSVATVTPALTVADPARNADSIIGAMQDAAKKGVSLLVFPELCITGYTCGDLLTTRRLAEATCTALARVREASAGLAMLVFVGAPLRFFGKLYNCAVALFDGHILGVVPKRYVPNDHEFYEKRYFAEGDFAGAETVELLGERVPLGKVLFRAESLPEFTVGAEICEDLWTVCPPSLSHAAAGATVLVNLSASNELVGKAAYRRSLVGGQSARTISAYLYSNAGSGESTTDVVFSGHSLIYENGHLLAERAPFCEGMQTAVIDVARLFDERIRHTTFPVGDDRTYTVVPFALPLREVEPPRYPADPFLPPEGESIAERAESMIEMQTHALMKRLTHSRAKTAVIGISGGLDSTLALLIAVRAMDHLGRDRRDVLAVTMPCFGTTVRTKTNAVMLAEALGVSVRTVDIKHAVEVHFADIGQSPETHDVTYENAQARERTQVLMDLANANGGLVVGTGDLSEVALGWSTYNGDHMSMYGVNASVPKTMVRYLVEYFAAGAEGDAKAALTDILATPVSPELLPAEDGKITQITEDIVGPYVLHDFFLYYAIHAGFPPKKLFRVACRTFAGRFEPATVLKWEKRFYGRFFSQQFKRSCMPDGPKVGSVSLSPRGDLRMPSDAVADAWLAELDEITC